MKDHYDAIVEWYSPKEKEEAEKPDKTKPSILLSSFVGCKGLSAGYVMIVGANDGSIPKDSCKISDVEIAQFMVALTRTKNNVISSLINGILLQNIRVVIKSPMKSQFF